MEVFFFIGIVICAFLALLIFNKKERSTSDTILGIWQLVLVLHFGLLYIRHSGLIQEYPHFIGLDTPFVLVHLPFIFYYTKSIVGRSLYFSGYLKHLLPFVIMIVVLGITFYFNSGNEKLTLYNAQLDGQKLYSIADIVLLCQCLYYLPFSYVLVRSRTKTLKSSYSNIDKMNLAWLEMLLKGASIYFGMIFILYAVYLSTSFNNFGLLSKINVLSFCIFQLLLGYFGIRYTPIFSEIDLKGKVHQKYRKTGLDDADAESRFKELQTYMSVHKPYKDLELTLNALAQQLGLSPNHLSQIINQFAKTNFYTYINTYRIEEVSKLLLDPSQNQYSILGLAYEAGFKSKSVFNALFKKVKKTTPSAYRKTYKKS
ncbi:helix-turn-helix domain-containing protein [Spongiimicrobium salis]|uniref:helix-turn-helix domain-containing protein n=1 Tax=Spongiimicrobium salis TaxID=1667022 RepID=UPI00374DF037